MLQTSQLFVQRLRLALHRDPVLLTMLILAAAYFLLYYLTDPTRPAGVFSGWFGYDDTALYPLGWFGYHDQGSYLNLSHTLADLNFGQLSSTYTYGLGYPLVAVPALWLGFNTDPFVFFNLFVFVFTVFAVYSAAKRFISPLGGLLASFGLVFATPLINYTVVPWNSTVCLLAVSGILLVAAAPKITRWHALVLGFLVGWAFAARYIDVVWLACLAIAALYRGSFGKLVKPGIFLVIGVTLWVLPVLYSHDRVFGSPLSTPYVNHLGVGGTGGNDQGAGAYSLKRIPSAALGMFVSPRLAGETDDDRGMFIEMFWVLAAVPGAIIMIKRKQYRFFFAVFSVITLAAFIFYLSFRASTPYSLKYGVLHYFKMFWPGIVILAVAFFDRQVTKAINLRAQIDTPQRSKKQNNTRRVAH